MPDHTSGEMPKNARMGGQQTLHHLQGLWAHRTACNRCTAMGRPWSRLLLAMLLLGQLCLACAGPLTPTVSPPRTPTALPPSGGETGLTYLQAVRSASTEGGEGSMRFALSAGSPLPASPERVPAGQTTPLSAEQTQAVLQRLPSLEEEASDKQEFRLPAETLPAPRPGETIQQIFPPLESATPGELPAAGPLQVLRFQPEGDVDQAPFLSVTFDQAMVALTAHADLAAQDVPVRLSPLPAGSWRWVGTKTLMFQPVGRFPKATRYTVEIPQGTVSATGGKLAQAVTWTFALPPPQMQSSFPTAGPQVRDPLLFVAFDQRIDPTAVLETIQVKATGKVFGLSLASQEQVDADETVKRLAKEAGEGYWLAFRASELFPYDTTVTVDIGPGTPSAEGPLTTQQVQSFQFVTYGPLRVVEAKCGWDSRCPPMTPLNIRFSNPLDEEAFDESLVQINPALPGGKLSIFGDTLRIEGRSEGRTTYKITLKAGIKDKFGQTLGQDEIVSIEVGSAEPTMYTSYQNLVVIDPASKPSYSVFTINYGALKVQAYAVQAADWPEYLRFLQDASRREAHGNPPGRKVLDQSLPIESAMDRLVETPIDLTPFLNNGKGHVILVIAPDQPQAGAPPDWKPEIRVWVQATHLGLEAFVDGQGMVAWANSLLDGAPLEGVDITVLPGQVTGKTSSSGLAQLELADQSQDQPAYLVARLGEDSALLPESSSWWSNGWRTGKPADEYRWYVFDDRQMYRPGEEVHVKGWIRLVKWNEGADVFTRPAQGSTVSYQLLDSRGNELFKDTLPINALGGFDATFTLPETMNLGYAHLRLVLSASGNGREHAHAFQVQEFRRPEFEVSTQISEGPHFVDGYATATVEAKYYAGGPLANAEVMWNVTSRPGTFRPPNWDDFDFGIWVPWWRFEYSRGFPGVDEARTETYAGRTDAAGTHSLRIDFGGVDPPRPTNVTAEATVMDVNRQAWSSSAQVLVHPADLYVGLRTERTFYEQGQPIEVQAIIVDLDGKPVLDRPIEIKAARLEWTYKKGEWVEEEVDVQQCTVGSADKAVSCEFATAEGGTYRITATIVDAQGRPNLTQITRWVSGGKQPTANRVEREEATLIPDRKEYQPGDIAEILVQAPFVPAEGLLTLRRGALLYTERFRMDKPTYTLQIPIEEMHIPNLHVQVDLVGAAPRLNSQGQPDESLPERPAYAAGGLELAVPAYSRTLSLQARPDQTELEPGGETWVHVDVKDAADRAVQGAEVAVVVVDEAVLALTDYDLADPVEVFYQNRASGVADYHSREYILLVEPELLAQEGGEIKAFAMPSMVPAPAAAPEMMRGAALDEAAQGAEAQPISIRTDFNPLAVFASSLPTDADGHAAVKVKLPDNLTRYRVMAVAVAGDNEFGQGESSITARLPLMVRPSPPRFLNFGDKFELPVVVQNQTDSPMDVDVVVRASNAQLLGSAGQRLTVPPRDRREVRFPFTTESAGTARFQVGAVAGNWADASAFSLPVYTPATTEAFAVYGTVDAGAIAQPVVAPSDAYVQFGGLDIQTSSTALQALTDAVLYLTDYPFECSEQLASRILAVAALRDVLSAFQASGLPSSEELVQAVQRDLERLQGLQNADGGFPVWRQGQESWPFHSIHVTHALVRARQKDFAVPDDTLNRALDYVRHVENKWPAWYSKDVRNTLLAYALYVRAQMDDWDMARARKLIKDEGVEQLQPEAIGWLLYVLSGDSASATEVSQIRRYLNNRVVETAGMANFTTSYREEDGYLLLASNRRADGVILEALMKDQADSDLIPKIVRGLMAHRKQGRWGNTQENVFILLALDKYFQTYEAQTPDFVARVWLGDQYVAGLQFKGRTTDYQAVKVPMSFLAERSGSQDLILSKEGEGRLYYRLGLTYAPKSLLLQPMDQGFAVLRSYEGVDDPQDVWQDEQGVWHVKAGARVRVRLTMVAPSRRYHVALMDPLPAGLEPLNPALAVTGSIPQDPQESARTPYWWWHWTWYEHQNLRDQRAEAFASLLWEGIHTYTYVARATTPGEFVVPPPKAEEMYSPEVFGRGATDRVVVE